MTHTAIFRNLAATVAASALALGSVAAYARPAPGLQDLVGARGSSGESALEQRGYVNINGYASGGSSYTYWWNASTHSCVQVQTSDGRYAAINTASNSDCNQSSHVSTGEAVAAGAAVVALTALLTHRSHHHSDGDHSADATSESEFERGYQDGLHGATYHNYGRSDAYTSGYESGTGQRDDNLSHSRGHGRGAGHMPSVGVSDIRGQNAIWADDEMRRRGFTNVDTFTSGSTIYSIWWNGSTRQCVQATSANTRIYDIRDIGSNPNCR